MARRAKRQEIARPIVQAVLGQYRCYWPNRWNRPCNKFLGVGRGELRRRCPRCKRECSFEQPNYSIS